MILEYKFDVGTAGGLDLSDAKLGAVALNAAVVRSGSGERQNNSELKAHSRAERLGVQPTEAEHLLDLIAGRAAGAGLRGVLCQSGARNEHEQKVRRRATMRGRTYGRPRQILFATNK